MKDKSGYFIVKEVGRVNEEEIRSYVRGIKYIENVIIEENGKNGEIKKVDEEKKEEEKDRKKGKSFSSYRIKITTSIADMVRVFEAMYESGMISVKVPIRVISELFFDEIPEQNKFVNKYHSTKDQMKKKDSSSNSDKLLKFILILARKSFKKKAKLDKLIGQLMELRKELEY